MSTRVIRFAKLARSIGTSVYLAREALKQLQCNCDGERCQCGGIRPLTLSPNPAPNSHMYLSVDDAVRLATAMLKDKYSISCRQSIYYNARDRVR
jgi:hypothetical protein